MLIGFYQSPDQLRDPRFRACPTDVIQAGNMVKNIAAKFTTH